jgi:hypothetical protein
MRQIHLYTPSTSVSRQTSLQPPKVPFTSRCDEDAIHTSNASCCRGAALDTPRAVSGMRQVQPPNVKEGEAG